MEIFEGKSKHSHSKAKKDSGKDLEGGKKNKESAKPVGYDISGQNGQEELKRLVDTE